MAATSTDWDALALRFSGPTARLESRGTLLATIGVVVRDPRWRTLPARMHAARSADADGDRWTLTGDHGGAGLGMHWRGEASCGRDAARFAFETTSIVPGRYARIGLCVLLPSDRVAGRPYTARAAGSTASGRLPTSIARHPLDPDAPYPIVGPFERLVVALHDGRSLHLRFEGSTFEIEDQRNWSDASFKAYPTPRPGAEDPILEAGDVIAQRVTCRITRGSADARRRPRPQSPTRLVPAAGPPLRLPAVGVSLGWAEPAEAARAVALLDPEHISVRIAPGGDDARTALAAAGRVAATVPAPLELVLYGGRGTPWDRVARELRSLGPSRLLVGHAGGVREAIEAAEGLSRLADAPVFVHAPFYELNAIGDELRGRAVAFPLSPQMHAFDAESIVSTLPTQREMRDQLLDRYGAAAVAVAPVEWTPGDMAAAAGLLPRLHDARLHSRMAAAWLLGSIQQLTGDGRLSATYFELLGDRGLLRAAGNRAARRTPAARVIAALARTRRQPVRPIEASRANAVAGLVVADPERPRTLLANLRESRQRVELADLGVPRELTLEPFDVLSIDANGRTTPI